MRAKRAATTAPRAEMAINMKKVIAYFGGAKNLAERLQLRGHSITVKGVEKWRERNSISGYWLAEMIAISVEDGRELQLADYLTDRAVREAERIARDVEELMGV